MGLDVVGIDISRKMLETAMIRRKKNLNTILFKLMHCGSLLKMILLIMCFLLDLSNNKRLL